MFQFDWLTIFIITMIGFSPLLIQHYRDYKRKGLNIKQARKQFKKDNPELINLATSKLAEWVEEKNIWIDPVLFEDQLRICVITVFKILDKFPDQTTATVARPLTETYALSLRYTDGQAAVQIIPKEHL